jgi:glycogen debranching enzyme
VEERRARSTVRHLMSPQLFTGWGIRCLSTDNASYNPLEYHNGTVWPHDTAICAAGMRRYGFHEEAGVVCRAVLDAAEKFTNQLPEVFAGFPRDHSGVPVEYPAALKPQSWAAGAPLLAIRTLLGLDVVDGKLRSRPHVPEELGSLRLRHVGYRGRYEDP